MILVLGGTTEGRKAVAELEEAGNIFYYSTKTGEQEVELCHGIAIQGAMTEEAMLAFCKQKQIRLLVDAAHPLPPYCTIRWQGWQINCGCPSSGLNASFLHVTRTSHG